VRVGKVVRNVCVHVSSVTMTLLRLTIIDDGSETRIGENGGG